MFEIKTVTKEIIDELSIYFSTKWKVPKQEYVKSMNEALVTKTGVPSWYYIKCDNKIIAGLGVIKNDFHKRHDLTPNICAVYVNEEYRKQGIAKELLNYTCNELKKKKIETVYLITTHRDFYERCKFNYYTDIKKMMVKL